MCINIQKETWEKQDWSNTKTLQFLGTEAGRAWLKVSIDWKCLGMIRENPMTLNKPNCNRKLASSLHKGQAQFKSWCMVWMKEAWRWCQESSRNIRNQLNGCSNLSKTKKRHGETRMSERVKERVCDSDSYTRCERATGRTMNQNLRNSHFFGELCWGPDVYRKTFFDWLQKYYAWRHDDSYFTYLRHMSCITGLPWKLTRPLKLSFCPCPWDPQQNSAPCKVRRHSIDSLRLWLIKQNGGQRDFGAATTNR